MSGISIRGSLSMERHFGYGASRPSLGWLLRNSLRPSYLFGWFANLIAVLFSRHTGIPTVTAKLRIRTFSSGSSVYYGVVSFRVVTSAFVNFLVDQLQAETSAIGDFKYHDVGTGSTAESAGDSSLESPYGVDRGVGTQVEGDSANVYKSVGTVTFSSGGSVTEHGLFNASSGGVLLDRSVFTGIPVSIGDSIQFTYDVTINSGG